MNIFDDTYMMKLTILDHLKECNIIDEEIKAKKNSLAQDESSQTLNNLEYHFERELADLCILLVQYLDDDLIEERMEKFRSKGNVFQK